jgi:enoyl-CoA hydratase/carnithine racemase
MQQLVALPQPVIARVQGVATAAGCQLACSCDLIVAAETARFGVNGINIGLFCSTPAVALTRRLAPGAAFELLTTGDFLPAPRAHALGLVNRLAAPDALVAETLALAQTIAAKDPAAIRLGKRAFQAQLGQPLAEAYARAGALMVENTLLPDTDRGIQAFLDRRTPPRS